MITLSNMWRFFQDIADYKTHFRRLSCQSLLDAVFISNMRDEVDRQRYKGNWSPQNGHFNGARYWLNGKTGQTRVLDTITADLVNHHGRRRAKEQFLSATAWAEKNGAKIILLAASTKRLFGDDGATLKERFPNLLFTIGDNGTALLLQNEIIRALNESKLTPEHCRIAVLGPYGLLGEIMTRTLAEKGYSIVGAGPNAAGLNRVARNYGIEICQSFEKMGNVDAVVACTHSDKIRLAAEYVDLIRHKHKKLLVLDVAEPSNLTEEEYIKCSDRVVRQDAGNAYSPHLKYVLGAISYRMFRLTRGVTFGCFAETLSLASALRRGEDIKHYDWFSVTEENMAVVDQLFRRDGFSIPSPRCFGRPVQSFNLEMDS